jgi:hypothetical protein
MINSKVLNILAGFTKDEMKSFEKFIASPYFSVGRSTSVFFSEIKKYYPEFNSPALEKENIFAQLFPGEKYNEKKLKNLSSDLIRLSEQFLIHDYIRSNNTEAIRFLAIQYKAKKNEKLFFKTLKALEEKVHENLFNSVEAFRYEEEAERLKAGYYAGRHDFEKYLLSWEEYSGYLTASFLVRYFRRLRDMYIARHGYNVPFDNAVFISVLESTDFNKMIGVLREKKYKYLWLIEIYYYIYKLVSEPNNEENIKALQKIFYENIGNFSRAEKFYIFNDMIDYWILKEDTEKGNHNHDSEVFDIYNESLARDGYAASEGDYMSVVFYRNVMMRALSLNKLEWLEDFINNYTRMLKPEYRDNMLNLARSNIFFRRKDFESALSSLGMVQYDFFMYKLDVKHLMLKIYYELELYDPAFSLVDAYKHFLSETDEVGKGHKKLHSSFLQYYGKLLKAKSMGKKEDVDYFINEMKKAENFASKGWLILKAEELIKKSN